MKKLMTKVSTLLFMAVIMFTLTLSAQASDAQVFAPVFDSTYYAENNTLFLLHQVKPLFLITYMLLML